MKSDMMKYKGYRATIAYDENDKIFVGEVFGITDSLSFSGISISELEESFHNRINNYIDLCAQLGKEPEKEFSGSFNVRITPALHKEASVYAAENRMTLNQVVSKAVEEFLRNNHFSHT